MQVMPEAALVMRIRYLTESVDVYLDCDNDSGVGLWYALQTMGEVTGLERYLKDYKVIRAVADANTVTEDMIERARNHPVESLIEFIRGKARCFNHDDNNPSMFYGNKTKRAVCPVCNKTWDAISVLQDRDGVSFKDAVMRLQ